jgi:glycosyltransferase involved in cell wall biosynthesis
MNILITAPNLNSEVNVSGISTVVNSIIEHNSQHHYFHFEIGKKDKKRSFFIEIIHLVYRILYFPFFLKRHQIDLIHLNVPFNFKGIIREFILNKIGKILKIKTLIHIHGGEFVFTKSSNYLLTYCIKTLLNDNEKVIVLSDLEKNTIGINYGFKHSIVLPNAIFIENQRRIKTFSKVPIFLFIGRIHESKGILEILKMFQKLKNDFDFKFFLFGDGPLKNVIIDDLNKILGDQFVYGGVVSGGKKMEFISQADYFLLPSRYGEGLPMALLESMSLGLIPIVSNDGSMQHLIQDGVNGIKVNKNDVEDLYEKIKIIVRNEEMQSEISKNAIDTVFSSHNIKNYLKDLNAIYNG